MLTDIDSFHEYLRTCKNIVALVGAGLSVKSGLPTHRASNEKWKNFQMIDLATPEAFQIDPGLVWQFYTHKRYQALEAVPNNGHRALAKLAQRSAPIFSNHLNPFFKHSSRGATPNDSPRASQGPEDPRFRFLTLTQNVDGLHQRASHPADHLVELHGSLFTLRCTSFMCTYREDCNYVHPLTPALRDNDVETPPSRKRKLSGEASVDKTPTAEAIPTLLSPVFQPVQQLEEAQLPHCPECHEGLLRPGVVWFGESLLFKAIDTVDRFMTSAKVDLILVIGTSGAVWPGVGYVERVKLQGGKVAVFNVETVSEGDWFFQGDAGDMLCEALKPLIE
ncbi:hypothetical protein BABINDRAFT_68832 [Babjeviella inositovora NRRL Y-12698]|uniref:Deacetylase sirtuin-type domain-containing protein n=1 Tax=Babjeviella inositovora NRRL Y-12698 TaxID=984486 RepID=A0A1E3QX70_9ASCO|nr:uncharacterized protein BABINDRAFT_68832 [Babjeviella inositovora NRRL Y-12698]ODQ82191.1 hypothetical protein BABINDRAFT_68832 [Babjeviella inositovora NRRL Y-12698]